MHDRLLDVPRTPATVELRYAVRTVPESWVLTEDKVPESTAHDDEAQRLKLLLQAWAKHTTRRVRIVRNLAVRWLQADPRIGIDPDVAVLEPAPDEADIKSLRLWVRGHAPPRLCFEIVSKNHPHKDYRDIQDRYAALGAEELVVFDPLLAGPRSLGGPVLLQKWQRRADVFVRESFGDDPVHSEVLDAWLVARDGRLVIADDREGTRVGQTELERERAEKDRERAEKERERAEKERERALRQELEREIAELRAKG
jgi:Uma2 family endonuclease